MQVSEVMTRNPTCCTPDANLQEVAQMMVHFNCGEIPVVENSQNLKPVGVVTDRDITCRTVAQGRNPLQVTVRECMSAPAVTVRADASLEDCFELMEHHRIRRLPVVGLDDACWGIITQADLARWAPADQSGRFLREVSETNSVGSLSVY